MLFVTDFADEAVMLPLAIVIGAALGALGWWRGLAAWVLAVGATFAIVLALKAGLDALSVAYGSDYMISPSGHVAASSIVYGGLALIVFGGRIPTAVIAAVPLAVAVIVGTSRIALGAHTLGEVIAGAVIGCSGFAALALTAGPRPRFATWPVATAGACTVLLLHGIHMPAEEAIRLASTSW